MCDVFGMWLWCVEDVFLLVIGVVVYKGGVYKILVFVYFV